MAGIFWLNCWDWPSNCCHRRRRRTFWLYQPYKRLRHCHNYSCSRNECARLLTFSRFYKVDLIRPCNFTFKSWIYVNWNIEYLYGRWRSEKAELYKNFATLWCFMFFILILYCVLLALFSLKIIFCSKVHFLFKN